MGTVIRIQIDDEHGTAFHYVEELTDEQITAVTNVVGQMPRHLRLRWIAEVARVQADAEAAARHAEREGWLL